MPESFLESTLIRLRVLARMIRPFRAAYAILAVFFLISPAVEVFNLTLMIPLFGLMLGVSGDASAVPAALRAVLQPFLSMPLGAVCLFFILLTVMRSAMSYFTHVQNDRLSHLVREYWMNRIFENYAHADFALIAGKSTGAMAHNIIHETSNAKTTLFQLMTLFSSVISMLIYFAMLLALEWRVTLGFSIAAGACLFAVNRLAVRVAVNLGAERVKASHQASSVISEALQGLREVKAFSLEDWLARRLRERLRRATSAQSRYARLSHIPRHFQDVFIVVVFMAAILLLSRSLGGGLARMFPAIVAYTFMAIRLVRLVDEILTTQLGVLYNLPALRAVQAEMESPNIRRRQSGTQKIGALDGDIRFEAVGFSYAAPEGARKTAVQDVTFTIPRRGLTALAGPSGCGKSTLADLLLRLYDPEQGRIVVNDTDLRAIDPASWRARIGFVAQEGYLFSGTIRENIEMGSPGAGEERVIEAARLAGAWDFIETLPGGLEAQVGERGASLSGGQRQRIRIARALIRKPDLLILDEATSALDTQSERAIQRAIETIRRTTAVVVIAHRLSLIETADSILLLEAGRVRAIGDYPTLAATDPLFASLTTATENLKAA